MLKFGKNLHLHNYTPHVNYAATKTSPLVPIDVVDPAILQIPIAVHVRRSAICDVHIRNVMVNVENIAFLVRSLADGSVCMWVGVTYRVVPHAIDFHATRGVKR